MVRTNKLTKIFHDRKRGEVVAVNQANIECKPGRVFGVLGLNGAGKTTLLRLLATILKPTSGSASISGFDVVQHPGEVKKRIGFLSGDTRLYPRLTAKETVAYFGRLNGLTQETIRHRSDEIFSRFGMNEFTDVRIDKLSTGMKQKVSIARTFIHDPEVLILDEPTAGLDVISSRGVVQFIKESKKSNKCVIFSTHIMHEAEKLCDDIAIIHKGEVMEVGTLGELQNKTGMAELDDIFVRIIGE